MSIIIISILHGGVIAHLPSDVVGPVGVVDVNLRLPLEVSHLLVLDQADDKGDQECDKKGNCCDNYVKAVLLNQHLHVY